MDTYLRKKATRRETNDSWPYKTNLWLLRYNNKNGLTQPKTCLGL